MAEIEVLWYSALRNLCYYCNAGEMLNIMLFLFQ